MAKSKTNHKWVVKSFNDYVDEDSYGEDECPEDGEGCTVDIVHTSFKHGMESHGWHSSSNISIFAGETLEDKEYKKYVKYAQDMCDALNAARVTPKISWNAAD
jgi:hypothetical protein